MFVYESFMSEVTKGFFLTITRLQSHKNIVVILIILNSYFEELRTQADRFVSLHRNI